MSIQRDTIPFGPAKIVRGADTLYSAKDIDVVVTTEYADVDSDQFGQGTKTIVDQIIEVVFNPQSLWSLLSKVWPASHINPTIGARLITATATPTVLHGEDGALLTIPASAYLEIPDLSIGVDKGEFGQMKIGGVTTNAKALGASGALFTYAKTGGTFGSASNPDYLAAGDWQVDYKDGALAGDLLEGVVLKPDFKTEAVKAGKRTLDYRIKGCQFGADVVAAFDLADLSAIHNDADTFLYGQRNSTAAGDLVFTAASGHTITVPSAAIMKTPAKFAMLSQRNQAISFMGSLLTGARVAWTTPA
jgi:hypothetical protein